MNTELFKQNSKANNRGIIPVSILDRKMKAHLYLHIEQTHRPSVSIISRLNFLGLNYIT